jgi:hypothetical protein
MLRDTRTPTNGSSIIHIDSTSGDIYYYDPVRSKNLGVATIQTNKFLFKRGRRHTHQFKWFCPTL